ncbi:ATP-binding protein [Pseudofrankia inefficax]|uniref:Putative transcriptional regulator n=1 Tax=Pseudofrankia inefficax (strain DSM 45817 / CECT 9037 / DDB 130130 / EuI1c) TaxID=298654 RepID=E3IYD1_PSEI1|nr:ATP-binding protein [Pseudofrankia inefficax]ADP83876.1 putative transcriptional regulator [Pseudofrankia inefficax]
MRNADGAPGGQGTPACPVTGAVDVTGRVVPGASWADLDPVEFDRLRRLIGAAREKADQRLAVLDDLALARELGVVRLAAPEGATDGSEPNGPSAEGADPARVEILLAGLLLFGRPEALRRLAPTHEAAIQVFDRIDGLATGTNVFLRWPLLRLVEEFLARFRELNPNREVRFDLVRMRVPVYSEAAFREALANALIHRDYTAPGAVHVQWSEDQIIVSNPSGLPAGITVDTLLSAPPSPRNPLLADAFRRAGLVARTGRGIGQIWREQLRHGHAPPDHGRSGDHAVVVVLPGGRPDLGFARFVLMHELVGRPLSLPELQIINRMRRQPRLRTEEVAQMLAVSKTEARRALFRMVRAGLVEIENAATPRRSWTLSDYTQRALRDSAAAVATGEAVAAGAEAPAGAAAGGPDLAKAPPTDKAAPPAEAAG